MPDWIVSSKESKIKLIDFVKIKVGDTFSNKQIKRALDFHQCFVNGKLENFAKTLLLEGDRISIFLEKTQIPTFETSRILYEDDFLLAYDKPPFITSISENGLGLDTLLQGYTSSLFPIHRLDRDTSGVILFAKTPKALEAFQELFKNHHIKKTYISIVHGSLKNSSGVIEKPMSPLRKTKNKVFWKVVTQGGIYARTDWNLLKKNENFSLIECHPFTGRTHQIRVHLSTLGHPIVGDFQYGIPSNVRVLRMLLHAQKTLFKHPFSHKTLTIEAPLPEDFQAALANLL